MSENSPMQDRILPNFLQFKLAGFCILLLALILVNARPLFAQQRVPDALIILERDPGYWGELGAASCPFYKLTIFADGSVKMEPKDYREYKVVVGPIVKSQITLQKLNQLVSAFDKADFFRFISTFENKQNDQADCPQYGTDDSTAFLTITLNGTTKRVEHYQGCRGTEALSKLTDLENKVEEAVDIKQWFDCYNGKNRVNLHRDN